MKLLEALIHATRNSITPTFSLFHCSSTGEYDLILTNKVKHYAPLLEDMRKEHVQRNAQEIVDRFKAESLKDETWGLEVRCNGVTVQFSGT